MKTDVKFFYVVVRTLQPSLIDGVPERIGTSSAYGEVGHMYVGGSLLCGEGTANILSRVKQKEGKGVRQAILETRKGDVKLCEKCCATYKSLPGTDWQRWVAAAV